jgi:hypothetical protein
MEILGPPVGAVASVIRDPEVALLVVQRVVIYVVNHLPRFSGHNESVHPQKLPDFSVLHGSRSVKPAFSALDSRPFVPADCFVIVLVDPGDESPRQWNFNRHV